MQNARDKILMDLVYELDDIQVKDLRDFAPLPVLELLISIASSLLEQKEKHSPQEFKQLLADYEAKREY